MSPDFKKIAARQIEEFKAENRSASRGATPPTSPTRTSIARRWLDECLTCKDNAFPQLLLLTGLTHDAADRIYQGIVEADRGPERLKPVLQPYDTKGSTRWVDFDTTRPVYATDPAKCHLSHVVADTESWEQKMAQTLEDMPEVEAYVKNHNLGFFIPYTINGEERRYVPDFLVRLRLGESSGAADGDSTDGGATAGGATDGGATLNLILEVSGEARKDKAAKVAAARSLWVPAVNNHAGFGRWAFLEISDPWDAQRAIRGLAAAPTGEVLRRASGGVDGEKRSRVALSPWPDRPYRECYNASPG
ncbi:MAG: hypothetical protein KKA32_16940 [Actinobacteria bacterium]|nr:hypothetical protein [Actinomycetota bacterium]